MISFTTMVPSDSYSFQKVTLRPQNVTWYTIFFFFLFVVNLTEKNGDKVFAKNLSDGDSKISSNNVKLEDPLEMQNVKGAWKHAALKSLTRGTPWAQISRHAYSFLPRLAHIRKLKVQLLSKRPGWKL